MSRPCPCTGRRASALRDLERLQLRAEELERDARATRSDIWGVESRLISATKDGGSARLKALLTAQRETLTGDLALLESEARRCRSRAAHATEILFEPNTTASCWTCAGTGTLQGNGSAQRGGVGARTVPE